MNKADVLFLDIYKSIRGSWAGAITFRAEVMLRLLDRTTLSYQETNFFDVHCRAMVGQYILNKKWFDGREWARDSEISYDDLQKLGWFDKEYYEEHTTYEDYEKFEEMFPAFVGKDVITNLLLTQLHGKEINSQGLDNHTQEDFNTTKENITKFIGKNIFERDYF